VYGYGYGPEQHPQAVLALVLGIIGLPFICFIFSIPAVIIGWKVHTEVKAEPTRWTGDKMGLAGFVMGLASTVLWLPGIVAQIVLYATG